MLRRQRLGRWTLSLVLLSLCLGTPLAAAPATPAAKLAPAAQAATSSLQDAFAAAAREFHVPDGILLAVSYNVSRWETHAGAPSFAGGYGPMHLTQVSAGQRGGKGDDVVRGPRRVPNNPALHTLDTAARLLGVSPELLKRDAPQNIRGGAALLARYAHDTVGTTPAAAAEWYGAVAAYSGSQEARVALDFADNVYATIQTGAARTTADGHQVTVPAQKVEPNLATAGALRLRNTANSGADCPSGVSCEFIAAAYELNGDGPTGYGNYDLADRPADGLDLRYIVIHNTEIDYATTVSLFQNPLAYVSTHYVVRSSDGHVAQMVDNNNVAWHAGNWYVNGHAIGVEHEGFAIEGATWYTEPMYRASARLVRYLARKYDIPLDRAHIVGHDEIPGPISAVHSGMHWDPGPFWDWAHYMTLLGTPITRKGRGASATTVTIAPRFASNQPYLTYCYPRLNMPPDCRDVPTQPANFVYLHTAPDPAAPLIADPYITSTSTHANNWANKAVTGQQFYRFATSGEWDGIYFGGQQAWFLNPGHATNTVPGRRTLIRPKAGAASVAVYGRAYPEDAAYPPGTVPQTVVPLEQYSIPAGQVYVAVGPFTSDYYWAPIYAPTLEESGHTVVKGQTAYYQIWFNHRFAFVKASDVELVLP